MRKIFKVAFWAYITAIVLVSIIPSAGITQVNINNSEYRIDYALHAMAFFILPILGFFAAGKNSNFYSKSWWLMILVSLLVAVVTEYIQLYVPGRRFNPLDIYSNLFGLMVGVIAVRFFLLFRRYGI